MQNFVFNYNAEFYSIVMQNFYVVQNFVMFMEWLGFYMISQSMLNQSINQIGKISKMCNFHSNGQNTLPSKQSQ